MTPEIATALTRATEAFVVLLGITGLSGWLLVLRNWWMHRSVASGNAVSQDVPVIPMRERHSPCWYFWDVLVLVGLLILISQQVQLYVSRGTDGPSQTIETQTQAIEERSPAQERFVQPSDKLAVKDASSGVKPVPIGRLVHRSVASLLTMAAMILLMRFRVRDPLARLGLIPQRRDFRDGVVGTVLILPPTMFVMFLVSLGVDYGHPILETLKVNRDLQAFAKLFVVTAVVTPLFEEFMFRVILQGGLERIASAWTDSDIAVQRGSGSEERLNRSAMWPVYASSLLFAVAHWGQGLAPVALFFMALGMGYLYRQTGSIFPSVMVHATLNALTLISTYAASVAL